MRLTTFFRRNIGRLNPDPLRNMRRYLACQITRCRYRQGGRLTSLSIHRMSLVRVDNGRCTNRRVSNRGAARRERLIADPTPPIKKPPKQGRGFGLPKKIARIPQGGWDS